MIRIKSLTNTVLRATVVFKTYPIEMLLSLSLFVHFLLSDCFQNQVLESIAMFMPFTLAVIYSANITFRNKYRFIYFTIVFPMLLVQYYLNFTYDDYLVTVSNYGIGILLVLIARRAATNTSFVHNAISYISAFVIACTFSGVFIGLVTAIIYTVKHLFNIDVSQDFITHTASFLYFIVTPALFLSFIDDLINKQLNTNNKWLAFFVNFIMSPALFIYAIILYAYIAKIIFQWQLPDGGVANMVFGFTILATITKALSTIISDNKFIRFYNYLSYISLPALALFWIGVVRRISDFGLTEERVLLFVFGIIMTVAMLMFMLKRVAKYYYLISFALVVILVMTYVPQLNPLALSMRSQYNIAKNQIGKLAFNINDGIIDKTKTLSLSDTTDVANYKKLNESLMYLSQQKRYNNILKIKNLSTVDDYYKMIGINMTELEDLLDDNSHKLLNADNNNNDFHFNFREYDIAGYSKMYTKIYYLNSKGKHSGNYYTLNNGIIDITIDDKIVATVDINAQLRKKLQDNNISINYIPTESAMKKINFFEYKFDNLKIYIDNLSLELDKNQQVQVKRVWIDCVLIK